MKLNIRDLNLETGGRVARTPAKKDPAARKYNSAIALMALLDALIGYDFADTPDTVKIGNVKKIAARILKLGKTKQINALMAKNLMRIWRARNYPSDTNEWTPGQARSYDMAFEHLPESGPRYRQIIRFAFARNFTGMRKSNIPSMKKNFTEAGVAKSIIKLYEDVMLGKFK